MAYAVEGEVKQLNVPLPKELHADVKGYAGLSEMDMREYVIEALEEAVKRSKKEQAHSR